MAADLQRDHRLRVDQLLELANALLGDQHQAHRFHSARGGAHAAAHKGEHDQHQWQEGGPGAEVVGGKPGGSGDRDGHEQAVNQAVLNGQDVTQDQVAAGNGDADQQYPEEKTRLGILAIAVQTAPAPGEEVQAEVEPGNHHEQATDQQDTMRGVSLRSLVGPGISARYSCMPPMPSMGSTATAITIIPMPPSHCSSCR